MRVTNSMMVKNQLDHLQKNMSDLNDLNEQLSSGKLFQMPSDAPIKVSDSMNYKSVLNKNSQYQRNLGRAENWLNSTESALKSGTEVIQRARELTVYASNDSMTPEDRQMVAKEFKELRDELVDISQTKLGDDYIFSGQKTNDKPFQVVDNYDKENNPTGDYVEYMGDKKNINREINDGVKMDVNLNGDDVFKDDIETLNKIYQTLEAEDSKGKDVEKYLSNMDESINNFAEQRSKVGAKLNRVDMTKSRLESQEVHIKEVKSENEDADLAEVITNLKMEETVYKASLSSGARIMQQSLVDFIR